MSMETKGRHPHQTFTARYGMMMIWQGN
jgi:hypothetical protein